MVGRVVGRQRRTDGACDVRSHICPMNDVPNSQLHRTVTGRVSEHAMTTRTLSVQEVWDSLGRAIEFDVLDGFGECLECYIKVAKGEGVGSEC